MQIKWLTFGDEELNPFASYNPVRPLVHWYNSRRMNKYVTRIVDQRFAELQNEHNEHNKASKSILDLVLTAHLSENVASKAQPLDLAFRSFTTNQVKLFLFSGHDTTSSTICYLFYILARHPTVLARLRAEHNSVLGPSLDPSRAAITLISDPFLLNKLPYTLAVIKETLRLYPTVSTTRIGEPHFSIIDADADANTGQHFPTDGFCVWDIPQVIHRDPRYWSRPDDFIPERWLVPAGDLLRPMAKGAWRPFSEGPRNCIGQELAVMEMKVILVMTARAFDVQVAYEEVDRAQGGTRGVKTVYGERGYQVQRAQPSGDLPCRVTQRH